MTIDPNIALKNRRSIRLRSIALPTEHGGWGFLLEPMVGAIAVAPSVGSIWIGLLFGGAFLTRQPLKIWVNDRLAKRNLPHTALAFRFMVAFGAVSAIGLAGSLLFVSFSSFVPILLIWPLVIYQIYCDANKKARRIIPEMSGAVAISSSAAVIALAGGWTLGAALALWCVFIGRLIPSIIYVRNRLRLEKGKEFMIFPVLASHLAALLTVGLLAASGVIPMLTIPIFILLTIRSMWGLTPLRKKVKAIRIGIWEVIYGLLTVVSLIVGHYSKI